MPVTTEHYKFTEGTRCHLDDIYHIQGLGDIEWWEPADDNDDIAVILKSIEVTIKIKYL